MPASAQHSSKITAESIRVDETSKSDNLLKEFSTADSVLENAEH